MAFPTSIKCAIVLGILGFLTNVLTDIFTTIIIVSRIGSFVFGAVLIALAILFIVLGFLRNEDTKKRYLYIWLFVFGLFAGIISFAVPSSFHQTASILNRMSIYVIIAISISNYLSQAWRFATNLTIKDVLSSKIINETDESLLYTVINMIPSLITSIFLSLTESGQLADVWKNGFSLSIIGWFVAAIIFAIVGIILGRNVDVVASKYESTATPIAEPGSYTNME